MHGHHNVRGSAAQITAIRAELTGSDTCAALGTFVHSSTPVIVLCRELVEKAVDPRRPLTACRGEIVCLYVRSIGEAARLEVASNSHGFIARDGLRRRPPMRSGGGGGVGHRAGNRGRR